MEVIVNEKSDSIKYYPDKTLLFEFGISDIIAIGEVTADRGPFSDDHFLLFITRNKMWNPIPTNASGFERLTNYLSTKLNIVSFIQMANRTDFKSRIVYPKYLEGKDFIKLELIPATSLWDKISFRLGIKNRFKVIALSEVYDQLQNTE